MKRSAVVLVLIAAGWPLAASAQNNLSPKLAHGRQILTQNCNVCHLPQNPGAKTYGPPLDKNAANGDDKLMKEVIQNGLVKMPGWKYTLKDSDIDDVIAYVRTIPVAAPPTARAGGGQPED
jgi:mono/diheme cytochrome c family protein